MGGWDDPSIAGTIQLFDLDGDGSDALIGLGAQGLMVNTWSAAWGQWAPANNLNQPFAFAGGSVRPETIRVGQLADGVYGAIALASDGSGLETWSWQPGDGSPGSGSWSLEGQHGPFSNADSSGTWTDAAYYSTIQFPPEPLDGAPYSIIARGAAGIQLCTWDGSSSWSCKQATTGFNDSLVTDNGNLTDYFYATIQLADVYTGARQLHCNLSIPPPCVFNCPLGEEAGVQSCQRSGNGGDNGGLAACRGLRAAIDATRARHEIVVDQGAAQPGVVVVMAQQDLVDLALGVLTVRLEAPGDPGEHDQELGRLHRHTHQPVAFEEGHKNGTLVGIGVAEIVGASARTRPCGSDRGAQCIKIRRVASFVPVSGEPHQPGAAQRA
jgi:hypothetical protein